MLGSQYLSENICFYFLNLKNAGNPQIKVKDTLLIPLLLKNIIDM